MNGCKAKTQTLKKLANYHLNSICSSEGADEKTQIP